MPLYGGDERGLERSFESSNLLLENAVGKITQYFISNMNDCFDSQDEGISIESGDDVKIFYLFKYRRNSRWLYLRKEVVRRSVLRIIKVSEGFAERVSGGVLSRPGGMPAPVVFTTYIQRRLRCELYLMFPRLLDMVKPTLDALVVELGYSDVEYADMSDNDAAWYPGERPVLPKARLVGV